jgi:hypothetical protein
MSRLAAFD